MDIEVDAAAVQARLKARDGRAQPPDAEMKSGLKLLASSRSSVAPKTPADTPIGIGSVGASTAMPAVPAKGVVVQQWKWAAVVRPDRPEKSEKKVNTLLTSSKLAMADPVPVRPPPPSGSNWV